MAGLEKRSFLMQDFITHYFGIDTLMVLFVYGQMG